MSGRIGALEGLRGWAALLVVIYHLPKWHHFLDVKLINNGHLMVPLFFVLSGFVIQSAYGHRINQPRALVRFMFLRFWRLYPVHLLFLSTFFLIECIRLVAVTYMQLSDVRLTPFSQNSFTALIEHLLLIQAIGPTGNAQTFNGPAWSISVEFYTYLVFGLLAVAFGRRLPLALVALLVVSSTLLTQATGFERLLTCFAGFSLGSLLFVLKQNKTLPMPSWITTAALITFFGYLAVSSTPHLFFVFALSGILVLTVSTAELQPKKLSFAIRLLSDRRSLWLGAISYSLYMCHALLLWVTANVFKRGAGLKESLQTDGTWLLELTAIQAVAASLLSVVCALTTAWLVMRFVEIPVREWSRRWVGINLPQQPTVIVSEGARS